MSLPDREAALRNLAKTYLQAIHDTSPEGTTSVQALAALGLMLSLMLSQTPPGAAGNWLEALKDALYAAAALSDDATPTPRYDA